MVTPETHKTMTGAAEETSLEVRYSPKVLREQRAKALKLGIFGVVTGIAGFTYGAWAMLHHRQVDVGADLYRHVLVPAWVLMLLCVLWGACSIWAMLRNVQQRKGLAHTEETDSPTKQP
jgi:hypothetical protein